MKNAIVEKNVVKQRLFILLSLLIVSLLGLGSKYYRGWGDNWLNNSLAAVWYEVFWCLFFLALFPKKIIFIPIGVFIMTSLLEFLQLWHPPFLQLLRSSTLGRLLLGTTFSEWDFFYYAIGCVIGGWWLRKILKYANAK